MELCSATLAESLSLAFELHSEEQRDTRIGLTSDMTDEGANEKHWMIDKSHTRLMPIRCGGKAVDLKAQAFTCAREKAEAIWEQERKI